MTNATLLLVDDDEALRRATRRGLSRHGYAVLEAANGREALRVMGEDGAAVELVVSDLQMPEMGGKELALRLAAEHAGVPVLLMSGYPEDAVLDQGLQPGATFFIQKPFSPSELAACVAGILAKQGNGDTAPAPPAPEAPR
jgi:two-component system cell cycle sensor histidine kinase/response regulator CckA